MRRAVLLCTARGARIPIEHASLLQDFHRNLEKSLFLPKALPLFLSNVVPPLLFGLLFSRHLFRPFHHDLFRTFSGTVPPWTQAGDTYRTPEVTRANPLPSVVFLFNVTICFTPLGTQVFERFSSSQNLELQQRSCEYLGLPEMGIDVMEEVTTNTFSMYFACSSILTIWRSRSSEKQGAFGNRTTSENQYTEKKALFFLLWLPDFGVGVDSKLSFGLFSS